MQWKIPAAVVVTAALMIPAASAMARTEPAEPAAASCQPVVVFTDIRERVPLDLDTASDTEVRVAANQILSAARADALTGLPDEIQAAMDGTADGLRAFLKADLEPVWTIDLRIAGLRTLSNAGPNEDAAAQKALDDGGIDALLSYLNDGRYSARARDAGTFKAFTDIRERVPLDLDTASDTEVRVAANQILSAARADALTGLPDEIQAAMDGTADGLRAFLKADLEPVWTIDLRIAGLRTLSNAGPNEDAAAQKALDDGGIDALLSYLNHSRYIAQARDCASLT